jgi:drug/metabolite transporter (DMT)-like permease
MPIGELAALGTAVCWSFTGLFFAEAARRIGALRVNLLRLPLALVMLSLALTATGTTFAAIDLTHACWLATSGVVGLVIGDLALFEAMRRIGPRLAFLIMSLAPIAASVAGLLLLAERPGRLGVLGIAVTLGGVIWVVGEPHAGEPHGSHETIGVVLAVVGAVCQGVGLVLAKLGMAGGVPPLAATWVRMGTATGVIWVLTALAGRTRGLGVPDAARRAWLPVLGGAAFGPFIGVWLSLVAAHLTDVGVAATIMATTPVLVIPSLMVLERYRPTARALVGTAVTVAGVALLFSS